VILTTLLWLIVSFQDLILVKILEMRLFVFLGSISYALYVYHYPIAKFVANFKPSPGFDDPRPVLIILICLLLSRLSLTLFERPILRLKEKGCS
jgi:peptidoglycan/LPS O-acetylase OafA/YrhL